MKIAQVSPLYEAVPPKLYGGTERVVAWLTDALVDAGHEVTLFASADALTRFQDRERPVLAERLQAIGRIDARDPGADDQNVEMIRVRIASRHRPYLAAGAVAA